MNSELASPKALGYGSIFIAGWLFSLFNTQWYSIPASNPEIIITGLVVGGAAVAVAGVISYLRGEAYEGTLFVGFGALFFVTSLTTYLTYSLMGGSGPSVMAGYIAIVWTVYFFSIWLGVMKRGILVNLFTFGLWLTLLDIAIANWIGSAVCMYVGGYIGMVTATLAACLGAREILKAVKQSGTSQTSQV